LSSCSSYSSSHPCRQPCHGFSVPGRLPHESAGCCRASSSLACPHCPVARRTYNPCRLCRGIPTTEGHRLGSTVGRNGSFPGTAPAQILIPAPTLHLPQHSTSPETPRHRLAVTSPELRLPPPLALLETLAHASRRNCNDSSKNRHAALSGLITPNYLCIRLHSFRALRKSYRNVTEPGLLMCEFLE
jgi:hypothetical protein